jgi:hypothetical protein
VSGAAARRLIREITAQIEARDALMDALPPGARITVTLQLGSNGLVKHTRVTIDSDMPTLGKPAPNGAEHRY